MNNAFRSAQGLQGIGSQAFNMGQAINQQQIQQGAMQQQMMQNLINAAKNQYKDLPPLQLISLDCRFWL